MWENKLIRFLIYIILLEIIVNRFKPPCKLSNGSIVQSTVSIYVFTASSLNHSNSDAEAAVVLMRNTSPVDQAFSISDPIS